VFHDKTLKTAREKLDQRKIEEIEFHNAIRFVSEDAHVADTRWSREMEDTIRSNRLWSNMKKSRALLVQGELSWGTCARSLLR
jgi:hypothetical protein